MSTILDFTSTTSSIRRAGCHARASIEPRSPKIENEASGATSQPCALRIATT